MSVILPIIALPALLLSQWLIFFYAPLEESLGLAQKIFYFHLPLSWWALLSFFLVFILSIMHLCKKNRATDIWSQAFAELGVLCATLALITGMIWGRISWGVWWTWDPRLTTTLIMWFIYCAYLALDFLQIPIERKAILRSVVGIAAFLDVPLVFFSARIFRSIHPAVFGSSSGSLEPEMQITALCAVLGTGLFWLALAFARGRQLLLQARLEKLEMRQLYQ